MNDILLLRYNLNIIPKEIGRKREREKDRETETKTERQRN